MKVEPINSLSVASEVARFIEANYPLAAEKGQLTPILEGMWLAMQAYGGCHAAANTVAASMPIKS